jgi:hypothetical protein
MSFLGRATSIGAKPFGIRMSNARVYEGLLGIFILKKYSQNAQLISE